MVCFCTAFAWVSGDESQTKAQQTLERLQAIQKFSSYLPLGAFGSSLLEKAKQDLLDNRTGDLFPGTEVPHLDSKENDRILSEYAVEDHAVFLPQTSSDRRERWLSWGNLGSASGIHLPPTIEIEISLNIILIGFSGEGHKSLNVSRDALHSWFEHLEHRVSHMVISGDAADSPTSHEHQHDLNGAVHVDTRVDYRYNYHVLDMSASVTPVIVRHLQHHRASEERRGDDITGSNKAGDGSEDGGVWYVGAHGMEELLDGLLTAVLPPSERRASYSLFVLNPPRSQLGGSDAIYGYRQGFSADDLRALSRDPTLLTAAAQRLWGEGGRAAEGGDEGASDGMDDGEEDEVHITPANAQPTPPPTQHGGKRRGNVKWRNVRGASAAWAQSWTLKQKGMRPQSLRDAAIEALSTPGPERRALLHSLQQWRELDRSDSLPGSSNLRPPPVVPECAVDAWVGDGRLAWIDLSAGPFSWGPTVGGSGVRSTDTLPFVPTTSATVRPPGWHSGRVSDLDHRAHGGAADAAAATPNATAGKAASAESAGSGGEEVRTISEEALQLQQELQLLTAMAESSCRGDAAIRAAKRATAAAAGTAAGSAVPAPVGEECAQLRQRQHFLRKFLTSFQLLHQQAIADGGRLQRGKLMVLRDAVADYRRTASASLVGTADGHAEGGDGAPDSDRFRVDAFLARLAAVMESFTRQVITPASGRPHPLPPAPPSHSHHRGPPSAPSAAAASASAHAHDPSSTRAVDVRRPTRVAYHLHIVTSHKSFSPVSRPAYDGPRRTAAAANAAAAAAGAGMGHFPTAEAARQHMMTADRTASQGGLDTAELERQLLQLRLPDVEVSWDVTRIAVEEDPGVAMALASAMRSSVVPTLTLAGKLKLQEQQFIDSRALAHELQILRRTDDKVRDRATASYSGDDSGLGVESHSVDVPIFLFSLDTDLPLFLDKHFTARAVRSRSLTHQGHDHFHPQATDLGGEEGAEGEDDGSFMTAASDGIGMVVAVQSSQRRWETNIACNGHAISWDLRNPIRSVLAETARLVSGLLPTHLAAQRSTQNSRLEGTAAQQRRKVKQGGIGYAAAAHNWLWSVGDNPLSFTSSQSHFNQFQRDTIHREEVVHALEASHAIVESVATAMQNVKTTVPNGRAMKSRAFRRRLRAVVRRHRRIRRLWSKISSHLGDIDFEGAAVHVNPMLRLSHRLLVDSRMLVHMLEPFRCTDSTTAISTHGTIWLAAPDQLNPTFVWVLLLTAASTVSIALWLRLRPRVKVKAKIN